MRQINKWSGQFTASLPALNNKHRLRQIRNFIGVNSYKGDFVLDIGAKNFISESLGITQNTRGDLNKGVVAPLASYKFITCLEVLNHVQQDLTLLEGIHGLLEDGGTLYLSTPALGMFAYSHGKGNYKELKVRNTLMLLELCGFKVIRKKILTCYPFLFIFYGFLQPLRWFKPFPGDTIHHAGAPKAKWYFFGTRPILKWLLHRYVIIEARKV